MISQPKECRVTLSVCSRASSTHRLAVWPWVVSSGNFQGLLDWTGAFLLAVVPNSLSTIRINWNQLIGNMLRFCSESVIYHFLEVALFQYIPHPIQLQNYS